ncbi:MAG: MFS transporter [Candidatus Omnitrophica bacterium]|nr:MFS transporter [Candidatus Omnitrophota bacterium]MCM8825412.1 MFS transporter [Candidatus Omnitrophota bacterium]
MNQIFVLGLVSFFVDISSEMIYPVIPIFLTTIVGANVAILGLIEGIAESAASLLKVLSGYMSDKIGKRKILALFGYGFSWPCKLFFVFASSWQFVFAGRFLDRIGKGIRTAPRDALIADYSVREKRGMAYGIHRAMDTFGALTGVLVVIFIITKTTDHNYGAAFYRNIFLISMIPALIGWLLLFAVKDRPTTIPNVQRFNMSFKSLPKRLKLFLIFTFIFALGNSSNQFLLLRIQMETGSLLIMMLAYLIFNLVYAVMSIPFGKISDIVGPKIVLISGYLVYGIVYWLFALKGSTQFYIFCLGLYGLYNALTEGVEKSLVSQLAPDNIRASMLGLHSTLSGIGLLPASIITGFLWQTFSPLVAFGFGGTLGIIAATGLLFIL